MISFLGGAYYVNQNGIPFIASQTSFGNINSAENTEGISDGISNPLDNIDDDNSSDGGDFGGSAEAAPVEVVPVEAVPEVAPTTESDMFALTTDSPGDDGMTAVSLDVPGDSLI